MRRSAIWILFSLTGGALGLSAGVALNSPLASGGYERLLGLAAVVFCGAVGLSLGVVAAMLQDRSPRPETLPPQGPQEPGDPGGA